MYLISKSQILKLNSKLYYQSKSYIFSISVTHLKDNKQNACRPSLYAATKRYHTATAFHSSNIGGSLVKPSRLLGTAAKNGSAWNKQSVTHTMSTAISGRVLDISGIYPPIVTPFDEQENIAYDRLKENLQKWNKCSFRGYVVQGSNGEYPYLTENERIQMVQKVRQLVPPGDKLIIAGSGCESTRDTIALSKKMSEAGADALLIITPSYYKNGMTNDALFQHFVKVAEASDKPIILYNVPANTGIDMAPELIIKLSHHPNIIGLKDSAGDISKIGNLVFKTKERQFQILAGSASFLYPALSAGCVGGVCALANVLGDDVCRLFKLFEDGNYREAQLLQHRLIAPNMAVTRQFGVPGLKRAMEWFSFYGGPTRSPLIPLTAEQTTLLKQTFIDSAFL